jgi:NTP pyrophosphatase (non-canonical NTP hydrolase)
MNNLKVEELIEKVTQWANDRNIIHGATPIKQAYKTLEECGELIESVSRQCVFTDHRNMNNMIPFSKNAIKDDIGDITVTLIIQCAMQGVDFADCLEGAYNEIKDRKGKLINGKFVKQEPKLVSEKESGDWRVLEVGENFEDGDQIKLQNGNWWDIEPYYFGMPHLIDCNIIRRKI